jgi:hypothetical protein
MRQPLLQLLWLRAFNKVFAQIKFFALCDFTQSQNLFEKTVIAGLTRNLGANNKDCGARRLRVKPAMTSW